MNKLLRNHEMPFTDIVDSLRKDDYKNAKSVLYSLLKINSPLFWKELYRSMELDQLASCNVTFRNWHKLARLIIQEDTLERLNVVQSLYSIMLKKEKALEDTIKQTTDTTEKARLELIKKQMECDLSRDYCQLGIVQMLIGAKNLDTEVLMKAEMNYLKAYEEDLKAPKPPTGRAWWNLSSSMLSRAQIHLARRDYLASFLVGYISVEMSLRRIWSSKIMVFKYLDAEKEALENWNIQHITQTLRMLDELNIDQKERLDTARKFRNKVIHAKGKLPHEENALGVIRLGKELLQINKPGGVFYHFGGWIQTSRELGC